MPVLGTISKSPSSPTFHGLWDSPEPANAGRSRLTLLLIMTILRSAAPLRHHDGDAQDIPKRHRGGKRRRKCIFEVREY